MHQFHPGNAAAEARVSRQHQVHRENAPPRRATGLRTPEARRQNPMHLYGSSSAHGPPGIPWPRPWRGKPHANGQPWRTAPQRWPLSHRCASVCIGGSKFLLRREPHRAAGEAGHHRKQNPMHLYGPAPAVCSPSQAAQPDRASPTKTPCTCSARPTADRRLWQRQTSRDRVDAGLSSTKARTPCTNSRRRLFGNTPCQAGNTPCQAGNTPCPAGNCPTGAAHRLARSAYETMVRLAHNRPAYDLARQSV
jgi:hypothetical protein